MSEGNYNNDNEKDNENEEYGVLTITSKIFYLVKCNVNILIDEQDVATMNSGGDSINLDVPEGNHSLKVTVGYDTSLPFNFTINTGDKINLTITNSNLLRGFLILTGLFFLPLGIVWCIIPYTRNLLFHPLSINMEPNPIRNNKYSTLVRKHNSDDEFGTLTLSYQAFSSRFERVSITIDGQKVCVLESGWEPVRLNIPVGYHKLMVGDCMNGFFCYDFSINFAGEEVKLIITSEKINLLIASLPRFRIKREPNTMTEKTAGGANH